MSVTVYSKPSCVQCTATYKALEQIGVSFQIIDISEDSHAFGVIQNLGYRQVPVVMVDDEHWAGFRPDKIKALLARILVTAG